MSKELTWKKSSRSTGAGGNCVEVAETPNEVHVRDSKNPTGATLQFSRDEWASFVRDVKNGTITA